MRIGVQEGAGRGARVEGVFERRGEPGQGQLILPLQLTQPRPGEMGFGKRRGKRDRLLVGVLGDFVGLRPPLAASAETRAGKSVGSKLACRA